RRADVRLRVVALAIVAQAPLRHVDVRAVLAAAVLREAVVPDRLGDVGAVTAPHERVARARGTEPRAIGDRRDVELAHRAEAARLPDAVAARGEIAKLDLAALTHDAAATAVERELHAVRAGRGRRDRRARIRKR